MRDTGVCVQRKTFSRAIVRPCPWRCGCQTNTKSKREKRSKNDSQRHPLDPRPSVSPRPRLGAACLCLPRGASAAPPRLLCALTFPFAVSPAFSSFVSLALRFHSSLRCNECFFQGSRPIHRFTFTFRRSPRCVVVCAVCVHLKKRLLYSRFLSDAFVVLSHLALARSIQSALRSPPTTSTRPPPTASASHPKNRGWTTFPANADGKMKCHDQDAAAAT